MPVSLGHNCLSNYYDAVMYLFSLTGLTQNNSHHFASQGVNFRISAETPWQAHTEYNQIRTLPRPESAEVL
jgi:hypothetical protein